jgi:hypothetical protein
LAGTLVIYPSDGVFFMSMTFDTKIAVILQSDLATWRKLNVTAFTVSGISGTDPGTVGEPYEDASGNCYLPMFRQPVMVYEGTREQLKRAYSRAMAREVKMAIFTEELFTTNNDIDNRAAVKSVNTDALNLVGMAMRGDKKVIDKVLDGLSLHK